jgi:hypothetical protein
VDSGGVLGSRFESQLQDANAFGGVGGVREKKRFV